MIEYNIHSGWTPGDQMGSVPSLLWEHTGNHVLVGIVITSLHNLVPRLFRGGGEKSQKHSRGIQERTKLSNPFL